MSQQPFTSAGVAAKLTELYALSNSLLAAQADAAESDFRAWVSNNFTLNTVQGSFLKDMNDHALKYYGSQCSVAFRSRLSISLTLGVEPIGPSSKWVVSESTLKVSANKDAVLETTGTVTFKTEYRT